MAFQNECRRLTDVANDFLRFARLRELSVQLQADHPAATALSAGMSADVEDAIAEGATHLRIGTALFGSRA